MIEDRSLMRGWPAGLVAIAEVTGVAAALHLVDAYRGTLLTVPTKFSEDHRLVQAIGPTAAGRLIAAYAGETINIPTLAGVRSRKTLVADAEGTTTEIARALGVSTRWVRMVRNAPGGVDPRQMDMFTLPPRD